MKANETMSEIKLLPCPFCGGKAEYREHHEDNGGVEVYYREYHYYIVSCDKCGLTFVSQIDKDDVIKRWNTRKPMQEIVERLEEEKAKAYKEWLKLSHFQDKGAYFECKRIIEIVKEVGGMNE